MDETVSIYDAVSLFGTKAIVIITETTSLKWHFHYSFTGAKTK